MRDWGKDLFNGLFVDILVSRIEDEVRRATGYTGKFDVYLRPWWDFRGPCTKIKYNRITGKVSEVYVLLPRSKLKYNSPWDVWFYGSTAAHEDLHVVDASLCEVIHEIEGEEREHEIEVKALGITKEYIKKYFPNWSKEKQKITNAIIKAIKDMKVD